MDAQKTNTTAKDVDANSALPMGKNAINAKRRASLLSSATARQSLMLPASDLANRNKYWDQEKVSRSSCRLRR